MIDFLKDLFSRSNLLDTTNRQDYVLEPAKLIEQAKDNENNEYINPEIQAIFNEFGGLCTGTKEIDLRRLLQIVPRARRKADAYKGLRRELINKYGVHLLITSTKKQNV